MSNVPRTNATRLFEVRGEEIVDDGLVFGRRLRHGCRAIRVVGGPRRRGRSVLCKQKRKHRQPDGDRHPFFAHFSRRPGLYNRRPPLFENIKQFNKNNNENDQ